MRLCYRTLNGKWTVATISAAKVGVFAVHKSVNAGRPAFTVTHIRSGYAVVFAPTASAAQAKAKAIQALDLDWDFRDPRQMPAWTKIQMSEFITRARAPGPADECCGPYGHGCK